MNSNIEKTLKSYADLLFNEIKEEFSVEDENNEKLREWCQQNTRAYFFPKLKYQPDLNAIDSTLKIIKEELNQIKTVLSSKETALKNAWIQNKAVKDKLGHINEIQNDIDLLVKNYMSNEAEQVLLNATKLSQELRILNQKINKKSDEMPRSFLGKALDYVKGLLNFTQDKFTTKTMFKNMGGGLSKCNKLVNESLIPKENELKNAKYERSQARIEQGIFLDEAGYDTFRENLYAKYKAHAHLSSKEYLLKLNKEVSALPLFKHKIRKQESENPENPRKLDEQGVSIESTRPRSGSAFF